MPGPALARLARELNTFLERNAAQADTQAGAQRVLDRLMEKQPAYYRQVLELASEQDNATPATRRIVERMQSMMTRSSERSDIRRTSS
jgi:hypothetical protein